MQQQRISDIGENVIHGEKYATTDNLRYRTKYYTRQKKYGTTDNPRDRTTCYKQGEKYNNR